MKKMLFWLLLLSSSLHVLAQRSPTLSASQTFETAPTNYIRTALLDETHIMAVYKSDASNASANTADLFGIVGEIDIYDGTVSWGTRFDIQTDEVQKTFIIPVSSTQAIVGYEYAVGDDIGRARVVTISGTSLSSLGTETSFSAGDFANADAAYLGSGKFVIAYDDQENSGHGTAVIGTITGTSVSFGTPEVFRAASIGIPSVQKISATRFVIGYENKDATNDPGEVVIGDFSGTDISYGLPAQVHSSVNTSPEVPVAVLDETTIIVAYGDDTATPVKGMAKVGTISGNSVSFGGSAIEFESSADFNNSIINDIFLMTTAGNEFVVAYTGTHSADKGYLNVGERDGNSITFGTREEYLANQSDDNRLVLPTQDSFVLVFQDELNSPKDQGKSIVGNLPPLDGVTFVEALGVSGQTVNLDNPQEIAISPDGKFVYVISQNSTDGITVFSRDAGTGKLTYSSEVPKGTTNVLIDAPRGIAISKDGGFAYVSGGSDNALNVFSRNTSTGVLSIIETHLDNSETGGTINTLTRPAGIAISPDNKHLIVLSSSSSESGISIFTRNTSDGTLAFLQEFRDDGIGGTITNLTAAQWASFSPDGKFVYVSAPGADALNIFSRETDPASADFGKLSFVSDITGATVDFVEDVRVSDDNAYIYIAAKIANQIVWASRNTSTGELGTLNTITNAEPGITSLKSVEDVVLSTDNTRLFSAASSADLLTVFNRDAGSGDLSFVQELIDDGSTVAVSTTDFGLNNNEDVAVSPDGKHLYALGQFEDVISLFSLNTPSEVPEIDLQQVGSIANGGSFDFGLVASGANSDIVFTIANTGGTALYAYDAQTSGDFSIQTDIASSTISAGGSTTFTVRFSPSSDGPKTAELLIVNTDVDEGAYTITLNGTGGVAAPTSATVAATVFLEGAFNGTNLNTTLNTDIPTSQPYNNNGHAGGENVGSVPANAVDWVLVELREAGSAAAALNATRVGSAAGFLMNDGSIKATDGTSNLTISLAGNTGSEFFVVIYHRNHLPIMSASTVSESSSLYTIDFTNASANTYLGVAGLASLSGGKFGMLAGDADGDGDVDATDLTTWQSQNGTEFTYGSSNGDFNLDGEINAVDRNDFQQKNDTKTSKVPTT